MDDIMFARQEWPGRDDAKWAYTHTNSPGGASDQDKSDFYGCLAWPCRPYTPHSFDVCISEIFKGTSATCWIKPQVKSALHHITYKKYITTRSSQTIFVDTQQGLLHKDLKERTVSATSTVNSHNFPIEWPTNMAATAKLWSTPSNSAWTFLAQRLWK